MPIEFSILKKSIAETKAGYTEVALVAEALRNYLCEQKIQELIKECHVFGATSIRVQDIFRDKLTELGFKEEKKGLFADTEVPALRPDFYRAVGNTGIILEVERGKTTTNNMDFLDLWKCHICPTAHYLFLVVPNDRPSANGKVLHPFRDVRRRLSSFFRPENYVNVEAVFLFGY
jgi:hypothetical protein